MATSRIQIESQVIELSKESFDTFCEEIAGIFGVDTECNQQAAAAETVQGLRKRFKKLVAVCSVKAEGTLDGTFQLVFDQDGLFTLAGLMLTHPEQMILENIKLGSLEKARQMSDVLTEAGHTLVGAWDRVFRKGLTGHNRFVQTNVFIGDPWEKPEDKMGLADDEEFVFVPCEIKISSYPPFNCAVIFPKTIFDGTSESNTDQPAPAEEKTQGQKAAIDKSDSEQADPAQKSDAQKIKPQKPPIEKDAAEKAAAEENTKEAPLAERKLDADEELKAAKKKTTAKKVNRSNKSAKKKKPKVVAEQKNKDVHADASDDVIEKKAADKSKESAAGGVSETIRKMTRSSAVLPGEPASPTTAENPPVDSINAALAICAKDIMQKDLLWARPDDSVQQTLTKMQQHDAGYVTIGQNGVLEGIVSKSDLTGAISPYLRPEFAKWCRPLDNATLQIKIKWIMSKTVHTIAPETSLAAIIENMRRLGVRCLPVVDPQGKTLGLVTVFDIFKALLKHNSNVPNTPGDTQ